MGVVCGGGFSFWVVIGEVYFIIWNWVKGRLYSKVIIYLLCYYNYKVN